MKYKPQNVFIAVNRSRGDSHRSETVEDVKTLRVCLEDGTKVGDVDFAVGKDGDCIPVLSLFSKDGKKLLAVLSVLPVGDDEVAVNLTDPRYKKTLYTHHGDLIIGDSDGVNDAPDMKPPRHEIRGAGGKFEIKKREAGDGKQ